MSILRHGSNGCWFLSDCIPAGHLVTAVEDLPTRRKTEDSGAQTDKQQPHTGRSTAPYCGEIGGSGLPSIAASHVAFCVWPPSDNPLL
jgi:hypothetical protein